MELYHSVQMVMDGNNEEQIKIYDSGLCSKFVSSNKEMWIWYLIDFSIWKGD